MVLLPGSFAGLAGQEITRPQIRQLFRLTGLDRRLAPARTLDEALDALAAAGGTRR